MQRAAFLILHGLENHRPPSHWQFQLAAGLAADGHVVRYPSLPDADSPSYDAWRAVIEDELARLAADAGGAERVVICHSLSCLLWLAAGPQFASELRPARVLLVSPPDSAAIPDSVADFRLDTAALAAEAIRGTATAALRFVGSDDDPYNPAGIAALYADPLGVPCDVIAGGGHITPDDGYGAWPSVRAWCDDATVALTPAR